MKLDKYLALAACTLSLHTATAQTITFETKDYKRVGVYDGWVDSPFRKNILQGNAQVIDNHLSAVDPLLGHAPNPSAKILGVQRSRLGSNTFGARIDLPTPLALSPTPKYVHVLIHRPTESRVMLMGLGKRRERVAQSPETEQFWELPMHRLTTGAWSDAVFEIKGVEGVDIYSLVVVPDLSSPHALQQDFAAYIDDIEINTSSSPRILRGDYTINFDKAQRYTRTDRYFSGVSMSTPSNGTQSVKADAQKLVYTDSPVRFNAKAGEKATFNFSYQGNAMHGYAYLDLGNDGKFDATLDATGKPTADTDLRSFSGYQGKDSEGKNSYFFTPPPFVIPSTLAPGTYRLRFKVDWDNIDAGGNMSSNNSIIANGGGIIDTQLRIYTDSVSVSDAQLNGHVVAKNGSQLNNYRIPFGKPFTVKVVPADGFTYSGIKVRHGYGLSGDSLIHGNSQWEETFIPAIAFRNNELTLPAELVDGDIQIVADFIEKTGEATPAAEDYPKSVAPTTMSDNSGSSLTRITLTPQKSAATALSTIVSASAKTVYRDMRNKSVGVQVNDLVTPSLSYFGPLNAYLFIDYDEDGQFTAQLNADSLPTMNSELVSFTRYAGKNSKGVAVPESTTTIAAMPPFQIPYGLPVGFYRARLKIDGENRSPEGSANIAAEGGYIVDFLLNIHQPTHPLIITSVNGSINGNLYAGMPTNIAPYTALQYRTFPISSSYTASELKVKHGHRFDGPQYVHGNRQWSEYTTPNVNYLKTLPKDSVDGEVHLSVNFQPNASPDYQLVFQEEFDGENGSQPDASKWGRAPRRNADWNRYMDNGNDVIFLRDGHLVARAIPNPNKTGESDAMLTGGIQSQGKFSFKYGKVEARALTNPFIGTFPAIWMMPEDQSDGWPTCGEIDIFETINTEDKSYHTVHSKWTYTLRNTSNPVSSKSVAALQNMYHTYGLEWNENRLSWYVDGRLVHTYSKSTDANALANGQWPFDKAFYLILNQSVGRGNWAAMPNFAHTYETIIDWVRVYQKPEQITGISTATSEASATPATIYDLSGRPTQQMQKGVYIVNGQKVIR